ncbi:MULTISPECIES: hypothetical protein [unclassified Rhizobium]|uniref:hypothetical protein n=1 Tax=unclassified Rhizobium TaxID=2613769 RepID=UPI00104CC705|nr:MULTISPECIES: hypothetical protein [unclassified Rhizobium]MBB3398520.1 sialic acid synthase SpsE [Rhizobium sp. BK060]MBB4171333.1 sialic acid synthase SpsE [Rhizobium sp. BK538]TCM74998.1 hypothetical protein EV291_11678 [Rhizobium sp. BK068]
MTLGESNSTHLSALEIAEAQFPAQAARVRQLFQMNETFRSMCEDLAAAAETLAHVERLPDNIRETRRQEYASLVDALVAEIGEALSQSKVVMLRRSGEAKPKPR